MKTWDAIVIGAGIIGITLALELNKRGLRVLVVDKGEPGREASWAAGGMLCDSPLETAPALRELATASAGMYPEFVQELQEQSGLKIDLRAVGTLVFAEADSVGHSPAATQAYDLLRPLADLEPALRMSTETGAQRAPVYIKERCVDPRDLTAAAVAAARRRGVEFSCGEPVLAVEVAGGKTSAVRTNRTQFATELVVNCAGAWAGQIEPHRIPTRPVKGHMLSVAMPRQEFVRHVVRTPDVYLIPRSDGRMVIGATSEEVGFDKQMVPETIQKLRQAAIDLVPEFANAPILETWAGLRPGTPDKLPILGPTPTPGYFVATGHFRDGILLAPVTAKMVAQLIAETKTELDLTPFHPARFRS